MDASTTVSPVAIAAPLEIGFCVADLGPSLRFYRDLLGFSVVSEIDTPEEQATRSGLASSAYRVVRLQLSTGERVKLFAPTASPERPAGASKAPLSRVGFAFLTLIVKDLAATLAHLSRAGVEARPPGRFSLRANVQVAIVDDPDGNVVELVQYDDLKLYRPELFDGLSRGEVRAPP